jgi:hypothetical protein
MVIISFDITVSSSSFIVIGLITHLITHRRPQSSPIAVINHLFDFRETSLPQVPHHIGELSSLAGDI